MIRKSYLLPCLGLVLCTGILRADTNWPDYRGPSADGLSQAIGLPLTWSETQNVRWNTPIHGRGWSTPVIWGKQVWLTTATPDGHEMFVLCLDKETGKILLDKKLFTNAETDNIHDVNSYASPSPVIEEGKVYVHFGKYGTACLDTHSFQTLWERLDLTCTHSVGPGSSPILYGNLLILTMDGTDVQFTVALNKQTGKNVWKTDRSVNMEPVAPERRKSFNTPMLVTVQGQTQMLSQSAQAGYAYDPKTGKELWKFQHNGYSNSSRMLVYGGLAYFNTGFDHSEIIAVRMDGKGDVTNTHVAWRYNRNVPSKPSALLVGDLLYLISDSGFATCVDAKTGAEVWKERIGGSYSASPLYAEGRIYCCSEDGKTLVLKPGRKYIVLAENRLKDGFMASPAVSDKALFLRTKTHLYRIEEGSKP